MDSTFDANFGDHAWYRLPENEVLTHVSSTVSGLTSREAKERLSLYGANKLPRGKSKSALILIWQQLSNPIVGVLVAAAILAVFADPENGLKNGLVIAAVVIVNTLVGFLQEYKAEREIRAIVGLVPECVQVLRDGVKIVLDAVQLTRGDIVYLTSGDRVPADIRLLTVKNLQIQEATLTGESTPVDKCTRALDGAQTLGDRRNMAYAGTFVTSGNGLGVVVEVNSRTELGKISQMLSDTISLETPLTAALRKIGQLITKGVCLLSALILAIGTVRTELATNKGLLQSLLDTLTFAVALAVAAIPEGLPAVVTIALAIGVRRMAARRAVVKRLPAVETLGSTTVICTDKTGTLTRNEMTVCQLWTPTEGTIVLSGVGYEPRGEFKREGAVILPNYEVTALLTAACLCSDAQLSCADGRYSIIGDPTEGALVVAAEKAQLKVEELRVSTSRLDVIPFESEHQYMATLHHQEAHENVIYVKGAPEVVLSRCDKEYRERALQETATMASTGMRVLAVARKNAANRVTLTKDDVKSGLDLVGLIALVDPPRPEARAAIEVCQNAGITVKMITGDHLATAQSIGQQLGLCAPMGQDKGYEAVSGTALSTMTDQEVEIVSARCNIFARVAPEHKLRLVRALQSQSHVVAMTGDGVNDSPALKQADIGIAMGISGTSASKEAASIVLSDDNFSTIAAAVEEGRRVYDNLIKSLAFILPTNLGLALILTTAVALFPFDAITKELLLPMNPAQLLWINLVATVALALPLAFEGQEPNLMQRPPRDPKLSLFPRTLQLRTATVAFALAIASILGFLLEYSQHEASSEALAKAQTLAVTTLIFCQVAYVLQCRSMTGALRIFKVNGNPYIFLGIAGLVTLQALFVYTPFLQSIFGTASLSTFEVLTSLGLSMLAIGTVTIIGTSSTHCLLKPRR